MSLHPRAILGLVVAAAAALVLPVVVPSPAAALTVRVPLYYADHTTSDWNVAESVALWNKNETIVLVKVADCAPEYQPCTTLIEKPDYTGALIQAGTTAGIWDFGLYAEHKYDHLSTIEMYTWWEDPGRDPLGALRLRQRVSCHELGHFVYATGDHPARGCVGPRDYSYRPGRWLRANIPPR